MISNLVSYFIASRLQKEPIYEQLASQDGIHLPRAENGDSRSARQAARVMRPVNELLDSEETIQSAWTKVSRDPRRAWLVNDPSGVIGMVMRSEVGESVSRGEGEKKGGDLRTCDEFPHLHTDQSFDDALSRMGQARTDMLPVV